MREISDSSSGAIILCVIYAFLLVETVHYAMAGNQLMLIVCVAEISVVSSIGGVMLWDAIARIARSRKAHHGRLRR